MVASVLDFEDEGCGDEGTDERLGSLRLREETEGEGKTQGQST